MTAVTSRQIVCPHCAATNRVPADKPADKGKCGKCGQMLFTGHPVVLAGTAANRHLQSSDIPVLIDFWAAWCGPCRTMAPVFEKAAAQLEPAVRLAKVDTEAEPALAQAFGITSIPTMILVHRGQEIARTSGAMPLSALVQWVRQFV
ncbi:MAG: thioredoxin TrxC [Rhodospirillaceae bacterium]